MIRLVFDFLLNNYLLTMLYIKRNISVFCSDGVDFVRGYVKYMFFFINNTLFCCDCSVWQTYNENRVTKKMNASCFDFDLPSRLIMIHEKICDWNEHNYSIIEYKLIWWNRVSLTRPQTCFLKGWYLYLYQIIDEPGGMLLYTEEG
jgi:hypothetical protein